MTLKQLKKTVIISNEPYIAQSFLQIPLYDNFNVKIGYEATDSYVQQVGENEYSVRVKTTYNFINGNSSINWQYNFLSNTESIIYPSDIPIASNIISTTGVYFGKTGVISIKAYDSGLREVTVGFNFN
tara:strand:+ start:234 stop:617 length:384 start_codon:yes stop_codon:yes gene_type:complete